MWKSDHLSQGLSILIALSLVRARGCMENWPSIFPHALSFHHTLSPVGEREIMKNQEGQRESMRGIQSTPNLTQLFFPVKALQLITVQCRKWGSEKGRNRGWKRVEDLGRPRTYVSEPSRKRLRTLSSLFVLRKLALTFPSYGLVIV